MTNDTGTTGVMNMNMWDTNQTLLLIELYKQHEHKHTTKKMMHEAISYHLKKEGYNYSADQVAGRWKSLMRAYKNTKDNNSISGSARKVFEFESNLDELFEKDPSIIPVLTLSSSSEKVKRKPHDETVESEEEEEEEEEPVPPQEKESPK